MFESKLLHHKKLLVVANSSWNIYNFRLNLLHQLYKHECEIVTVSPVDEYLKFICEIPGLRQIALKQLSRKATNPFKDLKLLFELKHVFKAEKPDIIVLYTHKPNIYGGVAAHLAGIKSVAVVTGLGYAFIRDGWLSKLTQMLYKFSSRFHSKVIFENKDDLELFQRLKIIKPEQGVAVKGCGVDMTRYKASKPKTKNEKTVFTFIGRLLYDKGIYEYVEAAQKLLKTKDFHNVEFQIVGEFDDGNPSMVRKSDLSEWVQNRGINYLGFREDIRPIIDNSDCVVLPSYREGMPRVILEALAMQTPVITTDVPGCRETVVEGENGFLVSVQDSDSLAQAMLMFAELSFEQRVAMGEKAYEMADRYFNSEKISQELFQIISQAYFCDK